MKEHGSLAPWPDCLCGGPSWQECQDGLAATARAAGPPDPPPLVTLVDQARIDYLFWRGFDT
ncbi:hypothetical protein QEX65_gp01 [Arthrobacter phage Noely]|uniref:Uncharacterized protein n=1 Tax=Arthrobacter phage Noely TaxID=2419964 RepID=A0A3G2KAC6_9CAUD|nr:hypothetical protein QEX65_gp01 [Arthrobacter phage Noely]AYN55942.1 hypothetical protein PBI_NOELY_1 [Arthrobacter phage Noely]